MQISKMAKKIAAISTGALMLGATLTGALAASYKLADYPAPFVKDGVLDNTVIVVGKAAATSDVVGAIDLAAALQAEAVSQEPIAGGFVDPVFSDGLKVEKTGEKFTYNADIEDIQSVYDDADLPDLLPEDEFEDEKYTQTLTFGSGSGILTFDSPGKVDKTEFDADSYLYFPNGVQVYEYELAFDSPLSYDELADLETKTIKLQGNTYTISDIKASSTTGQWTEMTLLAGDTTKWLQADEPLTVGENTITVVSVNNDETVCVVNVNGVSMSIDVGETETVGGMSIGVTKAFASNTKLSDACEVNVGAQELVLQNNNQVKMNGVEIDGSNVVITGNDTAETWDGFTITYAMDKDDFKDDEYGPAQYKKVGEVWTDPVFGNWKVAFEGISEKTEDLTLEADADEASLVFNNVDGNAVTVPFFSESNGVVTAAESETAPVLFAAGSSADTDNDPDVYLWYVLPGGEAHMLQFSEFDDETNKITLTEDGDDYKTSALSAIDGTTEVLTLGSLGDIELGWDAATNTLYYEPTGEVAETEYGAKVTFNSTDVILTSPNEDSDVQVADNVFRITLTEDSDADVDEINVGAPVVTSGAAFIASGENKVYSDNDVQMYMSAKGIKFEYDADEDSYLYVTYPEEDAYGNVFIAPVDALATAGGSSDATSDKVNPFSVGLAKLDVDAANLNSNMIAVGGPAANLIAFEIMGKPTDPAEGFKPGTAMLKYYDRNGKAALLVAGYEAEETVNACKVLAQHGKAQYKDQFAKLNDEVELVVTDMEKVVFSTA